MCVVLSTWSLAGAAGGRFSNSRALAIASDTVPDMVWDAERDTTRLLDEPEGALSCSCLLGPITRAVWRGRSYS